MKFYVHKMESDFAGKDGKFVQEKFVFFNGKFVSQIGPRQG